MGSLIGKTAASKPVKPEFESLSICQEREKNMGFAKLVQDIGATIAIAGAAPIGLILTHGGRKSYEQPLKPLDIVAIVCVLPWSLPLMLVGAAIAFPASKFSER